MRITSRDESKKSKNKKSSENQRLQEEKKPRITRKKKRTDGLRKIEAKKESQLYEGGKE